MLTEDEMKKILAASVAGKLRPTGLPMNRAKLDALAQSIPAGAPPPKTSSAPQKNPNTKP